MSQKGATDPYLCMLSSLIKFSCAVKLTELAQERLRAVFKVANVCQTYGVNVEEFLA